MTTNHPAHGPVSLDRLHQIREILSKAAAQSDGGNIGYAMADAVKVIDGFLESMAREQVRCEHAAWSWATFGDVGPVGPLKHLSKEALEAAVEPDDLSEWADMQFLLWDAQRRAGISDGEITAAMEEKLKVNIARQWPEPKDGEPRLHIKEQPAPVVPDAANGLMPCPFCGGKAHQLTIEQDDDPHFGGDVITCTECGASSHVEFGFKENLKSAWNSRTATLQAGNSPVIGIDLASGPDRTVEVRYVAPPGYVMVPKEPTEAMINAWLSEVANWRGHVAGYKAALAAAPQQENV
ncbi:TPA: Lar family restriction alleviation protein [Citrobacter freundii]